MFGFWATSNAQTDCCDQGDKPNSLTLTYNGESCANTSTSQDPSKYSCADVGGGPNGDPSVYIKVAEKEDGSGITFFTGNVSINTSFTVNSSGGGLSEFKSNTWFLVYSSQGGSLLQKVKIHTSCSAPLVTGDQFGSLVLESVKFKNGFVCEPPTPPEECPTPVITTNVPGGTNNVTVCAGDNIIYSTTDLGFPCLSYTWNFGSGANPATATGIGPHTVTYASAGSKTVSLTIDNDCEGGTGNTICDTPGGGGSSGNTDCCDQGDKPNSLTLTYNGESCANTSTSQDPSKYSCADVGGGPNGDPSVYIKVAEKEDGSGITFFTGNVSINTSFTVNSSGGGLSEFKSNTWFLVYSSQGGSLLQKVKIHTSCSAPLVAGDQFGSLVLESVTFKNGFTCGDPGPDCLECNKTVTKDITVENCQPVVGKIGDFVWEDTNNNGIQDPGEPGIPAAFVMLMTCNGAFVGSTFTDFNGMYMFNNLPAGSYRVFFANPNGNIYMPTLQNQGNDDAKDSDAGGNGWTDCYTLGAGQTNLTIDAGFKRLGPPPCNINVTISNIVCDGKNTPQTSDDTYTFVVNATGTGVSNAYTIGYSNGCLGAFLVGPTPYNTPVTLGPFPAGEFTCGNTFPPITFQNGLDIQVSVSDAQNFNCSTSTTVVSPGPCSPDAPASLGDFVWNDLNQNGQQDFGEPGVQGVTVNLYKCGGAFVSSTTTSGTGFYTFTGLAPNMQYFVEFLNLPSGFVFTTPNNAADNVDSDANQANGRTDCTFLSPGENDPTLDAGIFQPAPVLGSIGDFVWNDLNQNGIQDPGEPGVQGVTVRLKTCSNAVLEVTTTNASGFYSFDDLAAGCYRVSVDLPNGFVFSPANQGGNDAIDSDVLPATAMTGDINLGQGENNPTVDAGIYQQAPPSGKIGDFVWNDQNKNGIQDPGEPGVQGVLVKLFTCANTFIGQFTTNANGFYQFINLPAGSYYVEFSNLPAGFQFTTQNAGINDNLDSDANTANGRTDCFNLAAGQTDLSRDAGIFNPGGTGPGKIGDFVWFDTNANGIQDPGEPGIPNVFVILENCQGVYVNFAVTDQNGMYMFNNVQPGQYRIKFASPGSYNGSPVQFTVQNAGNDDAKDSDADWLGFTDCFTINPGETNLTFDAGLTGEGPPPPVCTLNGIVSNIVCNDNGTPNNPGDDTYTFKIIVNGTNTGDWGYDIPALGLYTLQFGQPYILGPFSISAGTLVLAINDHDVADCTTTVTVQPPAPCSTGTPCTATAGTLIASQNPVTLNGGSAVISAYHGQQPFVPAGFQKIYVLTKGAGLVIQATSNTPTFTVTSTGQYTIHTLVYNPATLNLGIIVPGVTTGFDVNALLIQGGGSICGALDVIGAPITVNPPTPVCDNVTNGGTIGYDETQCQPFDPANIVSLTLPSGGTGQLEYIWLKSTTGCPDDISQAIPGTNSPTYNPPFINQTTWYIRCARRVGCTQWIESNCIKKEVCNSGGGGCNISFNGGPGSITISGLNAPNVDVKVFNASWQTVFSCFNNCNNPQVVTGLPAGTYYVDVQTWNANWQPSCSESGYVTVSSQLLAPVGGIQDVPPVGLETDKVMDEVSGRDGGAVEATATFTVKDLKLFPNPASGFVMLEWTGADAGHAAKIVLLNQLGQVVEWMHVDDAAIGNYYLELDGLRDGQYMVQLQIEGQAPLVRKLVVNR